MSFETKLDKLSDYLKELVARKEKIPMVFSGPQIYFHQQAIKEAKGKDFLGDQHLKMIYAVLPAWGMHDKRRTVLLPFSKFKSQILRQERRLRKYRDITVADVKDITEVVSLLFAVKVNENVKEGSTTQIVSSSKTLHHILPNIVPPIDWSHSLKFLGGTSCEKMKARKFIEGMRTFIEKNEGTMRKFLVRDIDKLREDDFNTSLPKVFDNLIVAFIKNKQ